MISSLDDALTLLNKWKAKSTPVMVGVSGGLFEAPRTFSFSFLGAVTEVSDRRLEVRGDSDCALRADLSLAAFEYAEPSDRELSLTEDEREEARGVTAGTLAARWPDGYACLFSELREAGKKR
jgi:hypothetical protein